MKKSLALLALIGALISPVGAVAQTIAKNDLVEYARYTASFEGRKSKVYDPNPNDGKPEPTIGVGHYLDRADSRSTFSKALPEVDYDAVYSGRQELTSEQIDRLFAEDLPKYVKLAKGYFPKFDTYPLDLREALVDGCYRGDISGSPKTRALINAGKFEEAASEYLNNDEYKNASKKGMRGIEIRMRRNRDLIKKGRKSKK